MTTLRRRRINSPCTERWSAVNFVVLSKSVPPWHAIKCPSCWRCSVSATGRPAAEVRQKSFRIVIDVTSSPMQRQQVVVGVMKESRLRRTWRRAVTDATCRRFPSRKRFPSSAGRPVSATASRASTSSAAGRRAGILLRVSSSRGAWPDRRRRKSTNTQPLLVVTSLPRRVCRRRERLDLSEVQQKAGVDQVVGRGQP